MRDCSNCFLAGETLWGSGRICTSVVMISAAARKKILRSVRPIAMKRTPPLASEPGTMRPSKRVQSTCTSTHQRCRHGTEALPHQRNYTPCESFVYKNQCRKRLFQRSMWNMSVSSPPSQFTQRFQPCCVHSRVPRHGAAFSFGLLVFRTLALSTPVHPQVSLSYAAIHCQCSYLAKRSVLLLA